MRVVVFGDSLCLARPLEGIPEEKTYPNIIAMRTGWEVITSGKRARLSREVKSTEIIQEQIMNLNPDCVIIHLGIVDCCPRPYPLLFTNFINGFQSGIFKWVFKNIIFRRMNPWVNKTEFEDNVNNLVSQLVDRGIKVFIFSISKISSALEEKAPGITQNITEYNYSLLEIANKHTNTNYVDVDLFLDKDCMLPDLHHFNCKGNKQMAEASIKIVRGILQGEGLS